MSFKHCGHKDHCVTLLGRLKNSVVLAQVGLEAVHLSKLRWWVFQPNFKIQMIFPFVALVGDIITELADQEAAKPAFGQRGLNINSGQMVIFKTVSGQWNARICNLKTQMGREWLTGDFNDTTTLISSGIFDDII